MGTEDSVPPRLHQAVGRLFPDTYPALTALGVTPIDVPGLARERPLDLRQPFLSRLHALEERLITYFELLAEQVEEFESREDLVRLRAEGIATLISIRELWKHFPELRGAKG